MKKMLLMSGSKYKDTGYLVHCMPWLKTFLSEYRGKTIGFVPYAGVSRSYDEYENGVKQALAELEMDIISVHRGKTHLDIIEQADVIAIGGGNTFCLLNGLYEHHLLDAIRQKVQQGTPYFGWSAGANVAGKSIMTTNDMPILYPPSFDALNLFPHQINPHFISGKIAGHNGESREERLAEFLMINPESQVYALPEGTALHIQGQQASVLDISQAQQSAVLKLSKNGACQSYLAGSIFNY
ncbi:dipeptidase PepE [Avibacterium sp. 20-126]|uniref:dipeptidase PepE n=1 Tax=Avibacterium sp. 20-126 TaxID=2911524 RepID=UPI00218630FB|nr:dipeptidase PepE [Avibacterium sp. 20-126]